MPSLTRRTEVQAARREAVETGVLDATEELLREGGSFAALKVEDIAGRAGISRPAFYFYFRGKRELLMRLTEGVSELLYEQAEAWWSGDADGPTELREALVRVIGLYGEHAPLLRAVVEASAYDTVVAGFWRGLVGRFVSATQQRIEREQASGRIVALPPEQTAFALCWMTERVCYQQLVRGGGLEDPQFLEALVRAWVGTLYGRLD
jgi:TetR/AcrR family transcriptional regulator, ethionamide resistance regulator